MELVKSRGATDDRPTAESEYFFLCNELSECRPYNGCHYSLNLAKIFTFATTALRNGYVGRYLMLLYLRCALP